LEEAAAPDASQVSDEYLHRTAFVAVQVSNLNLVHYCVAHTMQPFFSALSSSFLLTFVLKNDFHLQSSPPFTSNLTRTLSGGFLMKAGRLAGGKGIAWPPIPTSSPSP